MAKRRKKQAIKPIPIIILLILLIVVVGVGIYLYSTGKLDKFFKHDDSTINEESSSIIASSKKQSHEEEDGIVEDIVYDDFQIHFLELGNKSAGDSVYIKAGNNDILIDAGSTADSATTIINYVNQYCTDGKLEYVFATHAHTDHISGFAGKVGNSSTVNAKGEHVERTGIFYYYEIGTLIDFAYKGSEGTDNKNAKASDYSSSTEYGKYLIGREYITNLNTTHYTAKELWDNNNTKIELTTDISVDILYNYYYFNKTSDENDYSVCTLFNYKDHHYLLTGDLEKKGEQKLAEYYDSSTLDKTLPHCDLFKGGHHGSDTASNDVLLSKITPDICCVCCCAGTSEYSPSNVIQFPSQDFVNRIAKYTSRVYVTSMYDKEIGDFTSLNGNIIVSSNGLKVGLSASNNLIRLKDSNWFNEDIYVDSDGKNTSSKKDYNFFDENSPNVTKIKRRTWPDYGV